MRCLAVLGLLALAGCASAMVEQDALDIVYEVAGHSIASAADLRIEVNSHAPGEQVVVKVRRGRQPDLVLTAHF
jgi:S1-C subfamily serine protease